MKIEKVTTIEQDCNFSGLTLLSKEEYIENEDHIELIDDWWWLRSPGNYSECASSIYYGDNLCDNIVCNIDGSVRPALILDSANLHVGDKFKFYEHNWTIISEQYALCDEPFCHMAFREYWPAKNANIYEASDVKTYLDNEWERMKIW